MTWPRSMAHGPAPGVVHGGPATMADCGARPSGRSGPRRLAATWEKKEGATSSLIWLIPRLGRHQASSALMAERRWHGCSEG
jgi:hypothetical protein